MTAVMLAREIYCFAPFSVGSNIRAYAFFLQLQRSIFHSQRLLVIIIVRLPLCVGFFPEFLSLRFSVSCILVCVNVQIAICKIHVVLSVAICSTMQFHLFFYNATLTYLLRNHYYYCSLQRTITMLRRLHLIHNILCASLISF